MFKREISALALCLILMAALSSCCKAPWAKFPMPVRPDRSCRTGGASGYDVYLWNCLNHQHIAIYKYSAEMSCLEPQKEVVACGEMTPIEQRLGDDVAKFCRPPPDAFRWP